jgi:hypothetical protein
MLILKNKNKTRYNTFLSLRLKAGEGLRATVLLGYKWSRIPGPESVIPNSPEFN